MQKNPNIANTEINVSTNRQLSEFYSLQFHKKNPQVTYILDAPEIKKTQENKKHVFMKKNFKT